MATNNVTATISDMSPEDKLELIITVAKLENIMDDAAVSASNLGTLRGIVLQTPKDERMELRDLILYVARQDVAAALALVRMKMGGRSRKSKRRKTKRR